MAKTNRNSAIVTVSLIACWLGMPGCATENDPARQAPIKLEMPPEVELLASAGAPSGSPDWDSSHFLCGVTKTGATIGKGIPCTADDPQKCYKKCGPLNIGYKEETCAGAAYAENSMCNFDPLGNFSCYRIPEPEEVDPRCPKDEVLAPRHNDPCDLPPCIVCGGNTNEQTTGYRDASQGLLKVGFCVCKPAVGEAKQKWACATMGTAWPCPNGFGC